MLLPTPHTVMLREMEFLGSTGMGNFAFFPGKSYNSEDTFFFSEPIPVPQSPGFLTERESGWQRHPSIEEAQDVYGMVWSGSRDG